MGKKTSPNGVRCSLIFIFLMIFLIMTGLCVYHFHQVQSYSDLLAAAKMVKDKPAIQECNWQLAGFCFLAILDAVFIVAFGFVCCVLDGHHAKILKQQETIDDLDKITCPECGQKLERDVAFCSSCGHKIQPKKQKEKTEQKDEAETQKKEKVKTKESK